MTEKTNKKTAAKKPVRKSYKERNSFGKRLVVNLLSAPFNAAAALAVVGFLGAAELPKSAAQPTTPPPQTQVVPNP